MRKICFRAWDKRQEKMILKFNLGVGGNSESEYFYIMQYTGLKDKNGKEIYEGDILSCTRMIDYDLFSDTVNLEVKFEGGAYMPMCENKMTKFRILPKHYYVEIIGNIYTDSHLLNNNP